eukprot:TRINITY_DN123_c0_g3_i2.p2 TRINITY_DN123_c0_g3~~TRINITY_DN123_c0_g3_i2.p2  ORF type:complete len:230 (-),score=30.26 TRINITY_DN123_c0_g3_i2:200-889(-)
MITIITVALLIVIAYANARSLAQFSATFTPSFPTPTPGLIFQNSANNVTDLSGTDFFAGEQLAGSFISSADNFTIGGLVNNTAIKGTTGAALTGGFDVAATNFGGSITNTTGVFSTRTAAADLVGYSTGQGGVTSTSTGTAIQNSILGLASQAGFSSGGSAVASDATFLGGVDVGGLLPNSSIGALTGALANPTGTAAGCSGASSASFLYGAAQSTTGCTVRSIIGPIN